MLLAAWLLPQLSQQHLQRMWRRSLDAWQQQLRWRVKQRAVAGALQASMLRRCLQAWQTRVDAQADWRAFDGRVMQHMLRMRCVQLCQPESCGAPHACTAPLLSVCLSRRLGLVLRLWGTAAIRQVQLRQLLAGCLQQRTQRQLQALFAAWRSHLLARVAKRMKQLSALMHWEQGLQRKALLVWAQRTAGWRHK